MQKYHRICRRKFRLRIHLVLVTKYRKKLLRGVLVDDVKQKIFDIAQKYGYHIVAMESDQDHIHILLDYDTTYSVANIVKQIKQETTYYAWKKYSVFLEKHDWKKKILWSDGYFACSIGEVSSETIKRYIEQQG